MDGNKEPSQSATSGNSKASEAVASPSSRVPSTSPTHAPSVVNGTSSIRPRSFSMSKIIGTPPQNCAQCSGLPACRPASQSLSYCENNPEIVQKEPSSGSANATLEHPLSSAEKWDITIKRAIKGIVSIKATKLRSFDTESAGSYTATGFVVDKRRGIVLTNRHIVNPSPTTSTAIFENYEEVTLHPVYYDPVHDFGFYKYDRSKIKFAEIEEIELYPAGAKVGLEIRVCGNDAGEKLSILGGTLARLDRSAPYYGDNSYNDFNTFYYQAASGTSGGSSGSPVLDIYGRAVALNAGASSSAASSFYLPLDRVVRALKLIQEGKCVPRGTLQTEFTYSSYDALKRLGLPDSIEKECRERNKNATGLLTISRVLPEGPGSVAGLEVGDMLLDCYQSAFGQRYMDSFYSLWEVIDESVGQELRLTLYRGKECKTVTINVQDLHSITPNRFVEIGSAVIHPLSYQLARSHHMACKGIFVATPGMFKPNKTESFLLTQLDGKSVESLESFIDIVLSIKDGKRVTYRYLKLGGSEAKFDIFEIDLHFFAIALFTCVNGVWERKVLSPTSIDNSEELKQPTESEGQGTWREELRKNFAMIHGCLPFSIDVSRLFRRLTLGLHTRFVCRSWYSRYNRTSSDDCYLSRSRPRLHMRLTHNDRQPEYSW